MFIAADALIIFSSVRSDMLTLNNMPLLTEL
jgi:hypothetical protein